METSVMAVGGRTLRFMPEASPGVSQNCYPTPHLPKIPCFSMGYFGGRGWQVPPPSISEATKRRRRFAASIGSSLATQKHQHQHQTSIEQQH